MNYRQLLEILKTINTENDLNENNIIEKIKEEKEKRENSGTDQELGGDESDYAFDDEPMLLRIVARHNLAKVAELLIKKGVNTDIVVDEYGRTPLHWAAEYGHLEIVKVLIENKANVNEADNNGRAPLHWVIEQKNVEMVKFLMDKGADPLLVSKDAKMLKFLIKLIKEDSLQHLEKAEESQQSKGQIDDRYESFKYSFLFGDNHHLIDVVEENTFGNLICTWLADEPKLEPNQKQLNIKLLGMLKDLPDCCITELENFLRDNKGNYDLKAILDLERGESKLTVLHVVSSMGWRARKCIDLLLSAGANPNAKNDRGKTPLHYAHDDTIVRSLIVKGADPNIKDSKGKTPREVAIDNHNYFIEECFLTEKQEKLKQKLGKVIYQYFLDYYTSNKVLNHNKLREFLNYYKSNEDLKMVLNLRNNRGKSRIFEMVRHIFRSNKAFCQEAESLLLEAGAIDYKESDQKEHLPKSRTLWDNLISIQQKSLEKFLEEVDKVQNMDGLEKIVTEAIKCGIRFNFPHQGKLYGNAYESKYSCMDYVIKKIKDLSKSEKNPKVASDIICKLVSVGAVLYDIHSMDLINTLELEFEGHKANMEQAFIEYKNYTLRFIEIAKSAATGEVKDAKIDNSTLYLEYSEDSTIHVAKITDGARDLGLTQGETGYGRDVIKIGKSEVEIITLNDIRYYTDLANGSDIVLTFFTSQGKLEVRLYPDEQDQDLIRVEGNKEMLRKLEDCGEEVGKNCRLGRLSVKEAIERKCFTRSGGLVRSEAMSPSKKVLEKAEAAMEGVKPGDIVNSSLGNTSSIEVVKLKSEGNAQNPTLISV